MTEHYLVGQIPFLVDKNGEPVTLTIFTDDPEPEVTACFGDGGVLVEFVDEKIILEDVT